MEEKAGRKERKKEVVEVWRPQAEDGPTLSQRPSYLLLPSWGCGGPAFLLIPPSFFPYPESFYHPVGGHTASLTTLLVLVPTGGGEWS